MSDPLIINPSFLELDDAYRGLAKQQYIQVKTDHLESIMKDMEQIGFVALEVINILESQNSWTIKASKGKHGPCKFTGSTVTYHGCAKAALDDDLHLLPKNRSIEVCDKTFAVFSLPSYQGLIVRKEQSLPASTNTDDNESEDFDYLVGKLFNELNNLKSELSNREMLFYPGPFRLLILEDGTLVRRGKWNAVPDHLKDQLIKKEGLISDHNISAESPTFLQEKYQKEGAVALMDELKLHKQESKETITDLSVLDSIGKPLKGRLLKLINENKKYFVLVGSDLSDKLGCCPSEEVTEANQLVKNGILNAFTEPDQGEACPLTFYSISDELTVSDEGFEVKFNDGFRHQIKNRLINSSSSSRKYVKWILIAFVLVSSLLAIKQCYHLQFSETSAKNYEQLKPLIPGQKQLVLFHNEKRCYQCLQMEALTEDIIENIFSEEINREKLVFKSITIDDPINRSLVDQLGIFAATLVVLEFDGETMTSARFLDRGVELYRDEAAFKEYVSAELAKMLEE